MGKQSKKKGNFLTSAHQALQRKGVVTTVYLVLLPVGHPGHGGPVLQQEL